MKNFLWLLLCIICLPVFSQEKKYKVAVVAFYNLENLYDTVNDSRVNDEDFLPNGPMLYNSYVYKDKLSKLSDVLSLIGTDEAAEGATMFGVAEVENRKVVQDLLAQPKLAGRNYKFVHYDSPDERGVDVAFVYNPKRFKVKSSEPLFVNLQGKGKGKWLTRDILWVSGELDGEPVHVFVNHWPSRRGGEEASAPARAEAARVARQVIDSLVKIDNKTKAILMGDLNDDPTSASVAEVLGAKFSKEEVKDGGLYNPWNDFLKKGLGTLAYQDSWNLFDQIIFSSALLSKDQSGYFFKNAHIFNRNFMVEKRGQYKGYGMRTYSNGIYNGGYSDHFPTYCVMLKEVK